VGQRQHYGTKIIPRFKVSTAATITTMIAKIPFKSFMARGYLCEEPSSVQYCTLSKTGGWPIYG
jgi:hypothetical protein